MSSPYIPLVARKKVLCSQGEDVTEMFVIISGCFQGVTWFEGGGGGRKGGGAGEREHKTRRILHSNCVNVLSALGVWHNAVETVTAETPGETYALTHIDFAGLFTSPGYVQQRKQRAILLYHGLANFHVPCAWELHEKKNVVSGE